MAADRTTLQTVPGGMNRCGDVVGGYQTPDKVSHGFVLNDGDLTSVDYPGATFTNAVGNSPCGVVVGRYRDAAGVVDADYLNGGQFTSCDAPNATFTGFTSSNARFLLTGFHSRVR